MNIKRILSSALVVIMLFSAIAVLMPVKAKAAHHSSISSTRLDDETVKTIIDNYQKKSKYADHEEMFQADLAAGYLDYSTDGKFTIYVNRYTGVMYYRNNTTGQMLVTNSYNFEGSTGYADQLTSQIIIDYTTVSDSAGATSLYSSISAARLNQISVSRIADGLRVNYAIGDTATRCLLPVMIEAHEFEKDIITPIVELIYNKMVEYFGEKYAINYFDPSGKYYNEETIYKKSTLHRESLYSSMPGSFYSDFKAKVQAFENSLPIDGYTEEVEIQVAEVNAIMSALRTIIGSYDTYNPASSTYNEKTAPEITKKGLAIYQSSETEYAMMYPTARLIQKYCPNYTFDMMYEDEAICEYEHKLEVKPVFRCALEYTFNEDSSLSVRLPANSIVFDETAFILKNITPLKYFGAANFNDDGYIFIPDGSGSIIQFEDFRGSNVAMTSALSIFGNDFCYSEITGAHKQPITMPVYGIASSKTVAGNKVSTGYFAILEEGASMAAMNVDFKSGMFREGSVFTTFTPYPTDKIDLSNSASVGTSSSYTKVSESKYAGSYVTRYVMLGDNSEYKASYMGMAEYYRGYLEKNGTLKALTNVGNDLPLYLEALGSLEVVEKILTFPVNISKPITSFEDVATIYKELGNAKAKLLEKAAEYDALAEAEDDSLELKASYEEVADNYRRLSEEVVNIDNINFKLTGFSNGGLYFTYPTRVRWERSLGGKRGFKELLRVAKENTDADSTFGVYPDFDFQYINNTSLFDGVGKRNTVSRMVDNRYASKQVYSSVTGKFDTIYAMIISADSLDRLYDKFINRYDNYDATGISVSTLGSDLNSNFDRDNPVSRDDAQGYVTELLDRIKNESNYSIMTTQGNIYAVKYADHILGVCTDSSYYRYSSYTIPFVGMVLHGYVNYTGAALNYSGSPDYDLLRSIENGASIYYIIGYQNTDVMKDDEEFNKFYSISYENWFDDIVEKYDIINEQLGDIQDFKIVDHEVLIGERVIDEDERIANLEAIKEEFIDQFRAKLESEIDATLESFLPTEYDKRISVDADIDALVAIAHDKFELDNDESLPESFRAALIAVLDEFKREYAVDTSDPSLTVVPVMVSTLDYESKYQYVTGSTARDDDYDRTDYTVANDLIVIVTYAHEDGRTRSFILNYNIYPVEVTLADGEEPYVIDKYSFARIDG